MFQIDEKIMSDNRTLITIQASKEEIDRLVKNGTLNYTFNENNDIYVTTPRSKNYDEYNRIIQENASGKIPYDLTFGGSIVIEKDLYVLGERTIMNNSEVSIEDNIIELNRNEVGDGITQLASGIQINRGTLGIANMLFDETHKAFTFDTNGNIKAFIYETGNFKTLGNIETQSLNTIQGVNVGGTLDVTGNTHLKGALTVDQLTTLKSALSVVGTTTLQNTLTTTGATWLKNTLKVDGASTLNNNLTVNNSHVLIAKNPTTGVGGTLTVQNDTKINGNLDVDGTTILRSTLENIGATHLKNNLTVDGTTLLKGATTLNDILNVIKDTTLSAKLNVAGISTFTSAANMLSTLTVDGATQLKSTLNVTGNTTGTTATYSGKVIINNALDVLLDTNLKNNAIITKNLTVGTVALPSATLINGTLTATGAVQFNHLLTVDNAATFKNTLTAQGATSLTDTLNVSGVTKLLNTLEVTGGTVLKSTLGVTGSANLSNTLSVTGITTLGNNLIVNGLLTNLKNDLIVDKNATIKGALTIEGSTIFSSPISSNESSTFNKTVTINDTTSNHALITNGNVLFNNNLNVIGMFTGADASFSKSVNIASDLTVRDASTFLNNLQVNQNLNVSGAASITGNGTIGGTLAVTGATSLNSSLTVSNATTLQNILNVTGATTLNSTLNVKGTSLFENTVEVQHANLNIRKSTGGVGGNIIAESNLTVGGALEVTGASTLNSSLLVKGNATFQGGVTLGGAPTADMQATTKKYVDYNLSLIEGKPYAKGETPPTNPELLWIDDGILKFWDNSQWSSLVGSLTTFNNKVNITTATTTVAVGIPQLNESKDLLIVFQNGVYLHRGSDYTLSSGIISKTSGVWENNVLEFLLLKSVNNPVFEFDGSLMQDGTLTESKMDTALAEKINNHYHNASNINAGVLNIARIPTGTTSTTVALGNHIHSASDITSGTIAAARLPIINAATATVGTIAYNAHTNLAGALYGGATAPTGTTRLNYSGYLYATRIYNAVYNDYAEYFEKGQDNLEPGDIIMLNPNLDIEEYIKCSEEYSQFAVGVVSDDYGQCLGGNGDGHDDENFTPIGLAGRVKVKVIGTINKGDYITISDIDGVGKAVNPNDFISGTVVGMALEFNDNPNIKRIRMLIKNL